MVCKERFARMTGMHPEHVDSSHMDHHPHMTAGFITDAEERNVERKVGRMIEGSQARLIR